VGDRPVSLPVCCGCERGPDGLDAVGSTRERADRHEHVAAVAVSTASASWGHPVDAATVRRTGRVRAVPQGPTCPEQSASGQG
jgi:hypothetical protein